MGDFDQFDLDTLYDIVSLDSPSQMKDQAAGWQGIAWLVETQLGRLSEATAQLAEQWNSPAGQRFIAEIGRVQQTLAAARDISASNHQAWSVIADWATTATNQFTALKALRDGSVAQAQIKYDAAQRQDAANVEWRDLFGNPDPPDYGAIRGEYDIKARQVMEQIDQAYLDQYSANLRPPPDYQGPTTARQPINPPSSATAVLISPDSGAGTSAAAGTSPGAGSVGGTAPPGPAGGGVATASGPTPAVPGPDGPALAGGVAAPPAPVALPAGTAPVPPAGGASGPSPAAGVPVGPVAVVPPSGSAGSQPRAGVAGKPPGRSLLPPVPADGTPVVGGRNAAPGATRGVPGGRRVGNTPVVGARGTQVVPGETGGSASPARSGAGGRVPRVGEPVIGRTGAAGRAGAGTGADDAVGRRSPAGRSPGVRVGDESGVVRPRPSERPTRGAAGAGRQGRRRRDERDREVPVAGSEQEPWYVEDDLPEVIDRPGGRDGDDQRPGPYLDGRGRRS